MKKLLLILLFTPILLTAQYKVNYEVIAVQDIKLAVIEDDYGNYPFTLDMVIKARVRKELTHISFNYERAELKDPYNRLSIGFGVNYRYKFVDFVQSLSYGVIVRQENKSYGSYGIDTELSFYITKRIKIVTMLQVTQRTDWGQLIRVSTFAGIGYLIR